MKRQERKANLRWGRLLVGLVAWGCNSPTEPARAAVKVSDPHAELIVFAAGMPCGLGEADLVEEVLSSVDAAARGLSGMGLYLAKVLRNPSPNDVLAEASAKRNHPVVFLYAGHAALRQGSSSELISRCSESGARCSSVLCLGGEALDVDRVISAVPAETPGAIWLLDGCTTAHVDVRVAKTPTAVISVSPVSVEVSDYRVSELSASVAGLASDLDLDCDGWLSDRELFSGINQVINVGTKDKPQPKLRRQSVEAIRIVPLPNSQTCRPVVRATKERPAREARRYFTTLFPSRERIAVYQVSGPIGLGDPITFEGQVFPPNEIVPLPCELDEGQCFRLLRDSERSGSTDKGGGP